MVVVVVMVMVMAMVVERGREMGVGEMQLNADQFKPVQ